MIALEKKHQHDDRHRHSKTIPAQTILKHTIHLTFYWDPVYGGERRPAPLCSHPMRQQRKGSILVEGRHPDMHRQINQREFAQKQRGT